MSKQFLYVKGENVHKQLKNTAVSSKHRLQVVIQSISLLFHQKKTAAACVLSRRPTDTNRKLQQELHGIFTNTQAQKWQASCLCFYTHRSINVCEKMWKKTIFTKDVEQIQMHVVPFNHRKMSCNWKITELSQKAPVNQFVTFISEYLMQLEKKKKYALFLCMASFDSVCIQRTMSSNLLQINNPINQCPTDTIMVEKWLNLLLHHVQSLVHDGLAGLKD